MRAVQHNEERVELQLDATAVLPEQQQWPLRYPA